MAGGGRSKRSDKNEQEPEHDGTSWSLDSVKELLSVQESTMMSFFSVFADSVNKRIDGILREVEGLKTSLEHSQAELAELKAVNIPKRIVALENNIESLLAKADDLENRSRRNNLCFEGIPELRYGNESWEKSEEKVKELIDNQLKMNSQDIIIERAHRVGRKVPEKSRPIIAKFLNYKDRDAVLKARKNLKGSRQVIREDFSERILQKRKDLIPKMNEARNEGKIAYLSYDKLVIKEPRHHQFAPYNHFHQAISDTNVNEDHTGE